LIEEERKGRCGRKKRREKKGFSLSPPSLPFSSSI
jgi:hypothetical protein